mmetsp:Transcript_23031/g.26307  ORF Transcript_23031/g.26307 Transcript_23031/m.26307 type:complete len:353 (+) Transcript_23031:55-1113(+)
MLSSSKVDFVSATKKAFVRLCLKWLDRLFSVAILMLNNVLSVTKTRQLFSFIFNSVLNHDLILRAIGLANKNMGVIKVVYCGYPTNKKYLQAYASGYTSKKSVIEKYKWSPFLAGIFCHDGGIGLKFGISATEEDFSSEEGRSSGLGKLNNRMDHIRSILHASDVTYAGTLPGILFRNGLHLNGKERQKVVRAVVKAIDKVCFREGFSEDCPIIILGHKGFVGSEVRKKLGEDRCYGVDLDPKTKLPDYESWPDHLQGQDAILVNISRAYQLEKYSNYIWKNLVLLNEVYPEPNKDSVHLYCAKGGNMYHLVGNVGWSLPPFPRAYAGGIPCSASWDYAGADTVIKCLSNEK